nr:MAG TPA: hypothetical protein [Caudoviricetes sp.]
MVTIKTKLLLKVNFFSLKQKWNSFTKRLYRPALSSKGAGVEGHIQKSP